MDHRKEAYSLSVMAGDRFSDQEEGLVAEKFYQMAFDWDNSSEELYMKHLKNLESQGKSMEGVKATVTRIFETSVKTGDIDLGKKQIGLILDLISAKFKQQD